VFRFYAENDGNWDFSWEEKENLLYQKRSLFIKILCYLFNLQSFRTSTFQFDHLNRNTSNFIKVFRTTLKETLQFDDNIIESIQNIKVEDVNVDKKVDLILGMFNCLSKGDKSRMFVQIIKYLEIHSCLPIQNVPTHRNIDRYTICE
jgi:hypothetical protein